MTSKQMLSLVFWLSAMTFVSWMPGAARAQWLEPRRELAFFEFGLGASGNRSDGFTSDLEGRGFRDSPVPVTVGWLVSAGAMLPTSRPGLDLGVVARWERLELGEYSRDVAGGREVYFWDTSAASLGLRVRQLLAGEWATLYGQLHGGLAYARVEAGPEDEATESLHYGWTIGGIAGLHANFFKYGGMFFEAGYSHGAVLENEAGQRHRDRGFGVAAGVRVRLVTRRGATTASVWRDEPRRSR